ncbi:MAG: hypothetical protein AAF840_18580, partial [Bacteroidota bacterium]
NGAVLPMPINTFTTGGDAAGCGEQIRALALDTLRLAPNDTLFFTVQYVRCCPDICNRDQVLTRYRFRARTFDICNEDNFRDEQPTFANGGRVKRAGEPLSSGPVTFRDQQTGTFCFEYPSYTLLGSGDSTEVVNFKLVLPVGFRYVPGTDSIILGNDSIPRPIATEINADQDSVTLTYRAQVFRIGTVRRVLLCFDAMFDCSIPGAGAMGNITVDWTHIPNPECDPFCEVPLRCDFYSVEGRCPIDCPEGGGLMVSALSQRENVGLADTNNDRRWEGNIPADPDVVRRDRLCPGDTLCTEAMARIAIGTESNGGPWTSGFFTQRLTYGSVFTPITAEGEMIVDGVAYTFSGLTADVESTNGDQVVY